MAGMDGGNGMSGVSGMESVGGLSRQRRLWIGVACGLAVGTGAFAQETGGVEPTPASERPVTPAGDVPGLGVDGVSERDAELDDASIAELRDLLLRDSRGDESVMPRESAAIEPAMPGAGVAAGLWETSLEGEGTFLVRRRATVLRAPTGEMVALLHATGDRGAQPVVLAPNETLERLERTMEGRGLDAAYWLTGQMTVYRDRNYLMPSAFGISEVTPMAEDVAALPEVEAEAAAEEDAGVDAIEPPAGSAIDAMNDPSVADLIADLEERRRVPRGLTVEGRGMGAAARGGSLEDVEASSAREPLVREGTFVLRRKARIVRTDGGAWAVALDGDGESPADDAPMVLLPCMMLERLERVAGEGGEGMPVEISGRVTAYKGRNFVLPALFLLFSER